jgi:hypothetical protein
MGGKPKKRSDAAAQRGETDKKPAAPQIGTQSDHSDDAPGEELSGEGTPGLTITGGGGHA